MLMLLLGVLRSSLSVLRVEVPLVELLLQTSDVLMQVLDGLVFFIKRCLMRDLQLLFKRGYLRFQIADLSSTLIAH